MGGTTEPNESFFIKQVHAVATSCLGQFIHDTGGKALAYNDPWSDTVIREAVKQELWRVDSQKMYLFPQGHNQHDGRKSEGVYFSKPFYDPTLSKINYGKDRKVDDAEEVNDAQTRVFDNTKGVEYVKISFEESVTLENSVEHNISQGMSMDVTSETTVSGSYGGVSAEQKLSIAFGVTFDESTTEAESKAQTQTLDIEFDVPPGKVLLLEIKKEQARIQTPFDVDGVLDFALAIDFYNWSGGLNHRYLGGKGYFEFASLEEFNQFYLGYDTGAPSMAGYYAHAADSRVKDAIAHLLAPSNRRIQCSGIKDRILQENADYDVTDITGQPVPEGVRVIDLGQGPDALSAEDRTYVERFQDYDDPQADAFTAKDF